MSKTHNYTKTILQEIVNNSKEYNEILRKLGIPTSGSHLKTLKRKLIKLNIDLTKFEENKLKHTNKQECFCLVCQDILKKYQKKFCSSSCAAIHNNSIRSKESREKQKNTVLNTIYNMSEEEFKLKFKHDRTSSINFESMGLTRERVIPFIDSVSNLTELLKVLGIKVTHHRRRILGLFLKTENLVLSIKAKELEKSCFICLESHNKKRECCSQSCAAIYRHLKNKCLETETNIKNFTNSSYIHGKYVSKKNCAVCGNFSGKRVTCSDKCLHEYRSMKATNNLRKRRLNGEDFSFRRKSKLEQTFENFLISKSISFRNEVYTKNPFSTGYFRLDFVIKHKKLIIEVDGKHHEKPKQRKHDIIRDFAMIERGWKVLRVNYYEVNKPAILEMIYNQFLKP